MKLGAKTLFKHWKKHWDSIKQAVDKSPGSWHGINLVFIHYSHIVEPRCLHLLSQLSLYKLETARVRSFRQWTTFVFCNVPLPPVSRWWARPSSSTEDSGPSPGTLSRWRSSSSARGWTRSRSDRLLPSCPSASGPRCRCRRPEHLETTGGGVTTTFTTFWPGKHNEYSFPLEMCHPAAYFQSCSAALHLLCVTTWE